MICILSVAAHTVGAVLVLFRPFCSNCRSNTLLLEAGISNSLDIEENGKERGWILGREIITA